MLQALALSRLRIAQQRAGRSDGGAQAFCAEAAQGCDIKLFQQCFLAAGKIEMPVRHPHGFTGNTGLQHNIAAIGQQNFSRHDAFQFLLQARLGCVRRLREFHQLQCTAGHREPSEANSDGFALHNLGEGQQRLFGFVRQQMRVAQGAGRDDALYLAFDRSLAGCRVADLFADRNRFALFDELGQILISRMIRNAGHFDRIAARCTALGQRNAQ